MMSGDMMSGYMMSGYTRSDSAPSSSSPFHMVMAPLAAPAKPPKNMMALIQRSRVVQRRESRLST